MYTFQHTCASSTGEQWWWEDLHISSFLQLDRMKELNSNLLILQNTTILLNQGLIISIHRSLQITSLLHWCHTLQMWITAMILGQVIQSIATPHSPVTIDRESSPSMLHHPKVDHRYDPSDAKYDISHSSVTADHKTASLAPHLPCVEHHYSPSDTRFSNLHSPVSTETTPLIGHRYDPNHTWYSVSHEPFTTNT